MSRTPAQISQRWGFRSALLSEYCNLSPTNRLVLLALDSFRSEQSPQPFPSQARLAVVTGLSERAVRNALIQSAALGWLNKINRFRENGGKTSNLYECLVPESFRQAAGAALTPPPAPDAPPIGTTCLSPPAPRADEVLSLNTELNTGAGENGNGKKNGHPTWLTPFGEAYERKAGIPDYGEMARYLRPVFEKLGAGDALTAFEDFLASEQARYGMKYFKGHVRDYQPTPLLLDNGDLNPDAVERAKRRGIQL